MQNSVGRIAQSVLQAQVACLADGSRRDVNSL